MLQPYVFNSSVFSTTQHVTTSIHVQARADLDMDSIGFSIYVLDSNQAQ